MIPSIKKISVIGDGGWGTTLAVYLAGKKFPVTLWGAFADNIRAIQKTRYNAKFLPGIKIPRAVQATADLSAAVGQADLLVIAVPSEFAGGVVQKLGRLDLSGKAILSVIKGIDTRQLKRISQIIRQELGNVPLAVLSGPNIATEVARGVPSTAVIASNNATLAKSLQRIFNSQRFRIYTNTDLIGIELGGSLKNVIAIACGVCDGLGFGTNTKAALLTRGLAEMARLGQAMGAKFDTFYGLAGLGDLATTCFSPSSRNRTVGEQLGKGKNIRQITANMAMVAEGVITAKAVHQLSQKYKIPMPISTEVYNILYRGKKPQKAVADLMRRKLKVE